MAKLVIGCGESMVDAIRTADNDPENMTLARFLFPDHADGAEWAVLVDADESDLDMDRAVIRYRTVGDFALALGACQGVDPRDPALRGRAVQAMISGDAVG